MELFCFWDSRGTFQEGVFLIFETQRKGVFCVKAGNFLHHSDLMKNELQTGKQKTFIAAGRFDGAGEVISWHSERYQVYTPNELKSQISTFMKDEIPKQK